MKLVIDEVRDIVHAMSEKRTDQIFVWGGAIIAGLLGTVGYLVTHFVLR